MAVEQLKLQLIAIKCFQLLTLVDDFVYCRLTPKSVVHFQEKLHFQIQSKQVLSVVILGIARCAKKLLEQVRCRLEKFWGQISATDIFVFKFQVNAKHISEKW